MAAYMRHQFDFLGLTNPARAPLTRQVLAGLTRPTEDDMRDVAAACWDLPQREYQYFAAGWLRKHVRVATPRLLPVVRR